MVSMTRAEAIDRACYERLDTEALEHLYDTALIAGLQKALRLIGHNTACDAEDAIRAEITRLRKGAKEK